MIVRNLSVNHGLCNGTRVQVIDMKPTVLKVKILSGAHRDSVHFIPRVTLDTKDVKELPFNMHRRQFPVKLAYRYVLIFQISIFSLFFFSMTINKAQGQTLDKVGLFLRSPVFTHGQLYVACSRVRSMDSLRIQLAETPRQSAKNGETVTDNIVFKEVL